MIYAIDWDGTVCTYDTFPEIGPELDDAVLCMKDLQKLGHRVIIWTCRAGANLDLVKQWLKDHDFVPDAINDDVRSTKIWMRRDKLVLNKDCYNKVFAHYYIDDRSWPPWPGWKVFREQVITKEQNEKAAEASSVKSRKPRLRNVRQATTCGS